MLSLTYQMILLIWLLLLLLLLLVLSFVSMCMALDSTPSRREDSICMLLHRSHCLPEDCPHSSVTSFELFFDFWFQSLPNDGSICVYQFVTCSSELRSGLFCIRVNFQYQIPWRWCSFCILLVFQSANACPDSWDTLHWWDVQRR